MADNYLHQSTDAITYLTVYMYRSNMDSIPNYPLPTGYSLQLYKDDVNDKQQWADITMAAGEFRSLEEGLHKFEEYFSKTKDKIPLTQRVHFLVNSDGKYIGTATAGIDEAHVEDYGSLDWISILPEYQGKKLAKPMVCAVLHKVAKYSNKCYLSSQTTSWRAINMYADLGFLPFIKTDGCKKAWQLLNKLCRRKFIDETEAIQSIKGKTVLITGGNTGIGYETAMELLQRGARVVLACRNVNKGYDAMNKLVAKTGSNQESIRVMECDLCSLDSVRAFAKMYNEEENRLDILICNAGLGWSPSVLTKDGFNAVMQANYLGHFLLTNLLIDKLKKCRPSRIINVSSELHKAVKSIDWSDALTQIHTSRWMGAYPLSKLFQILSTLKLKGDLPNTEGINIFALTPGWVSTSIQDPVEYGLGIFGLIFYYPLLYCLKFAFAKTAKTGAQTVIYCAVESKLEQSQDLYFENCAAAKVSSLAIDEVSIDRLWKVSCEAVGL
ncbi:unnamed protein product [Rotaria socialis]|nr:unnamed protein product [Rotaria socialis]